MEKQKHIVHLDDHSLITIAIENLLNKFFPDCSCHGFSNTEKAWRFIKNLLLSDEKIGLIVTDFVYSGPNGYEFAKNIRELEMKKNFKSIPIILLTMIDETNPMVKRGLKDNIFNNCLSLASPEKVLIQTFRDSLKHK